MSALPNHRGPFLTREQSAVVRERRFLQPGHLLICEAPTTITTILGSCVAVCMWDPTRGVGGMNHFMLPMTTAGTAAGPRFGAVAMEELVAKLRGLGARLPFLRARVYGGSCMFAHMNPAAGNKVHLGTQNVNLALDFISRNGIELVDVQVGGSRGRKLLFQTDEGSVCLTSI
jgi:chemotaxis protein CheD